MNRRKRIVVAGVVAAVALGGVLRWWRDYPVHHFAVVREGVLYRSGQPSEAQLALLAGRYHIRTVVNLRGQAPDQDWYRREVAFCQGHGIQLVHMTMSDKPAIAANVRRILDLVADPRNCPVLIHCEAGSARTGFVTAAFRVVFDGWSYEKAMEEARGLRFPTLHKEIYREYDRILRGLAARKGDLSMTAGLSPGHRP